MKRALAMAYVVAWVAILGGLTAEVGLAVSRRSRLRSAERYREVNLFDQARAIAEAEGETLWLHRGERYRPEAALETVVAGERYQIRINRWGFRTQEFEKRKPPGLRRVVCIGGSTTVQGRTDDETYPALLAKTLNRNRVGPPIEVLNLGISGTGSEYWLQRLDELFALDPDVIVQYEFVNDFFWHHLPRYAAEHRWRRLVRHSLLLGRLCPPQPEEFGDGFDQTLRRFVRLERVARAHGAEYVVGSFAAPDAHHAETDFRDYLDLNVEAWGGRSGLARFADYRAILDAYNRRFTAFVADRGLKAAMVHQLVRDPELFVDLCHMTPRGIEALAEAFRPAVSAALGAQKTNGPGASGW